MSKQHIRTIFAAVLGLWITQACTKVVPVAPLRTPDNSGDTTHDVRKVLDSASQFSLFAYACSKTGVTAGLQPNAFYTLFAPTDSAMEAAGLTRSGIDQLPLDSLTRLVQYHITEGAVSDTALEGALVSVQQNCLLETVFFQSQENRLAGYSTYRHSLYVKTYNGVLTVNGWVVNQGEPVLRASNGYLYAIHRVLIPPTQKVSDVVFTRPEFTDYAVAIATLDSIYRGIGYGDLTYQDTVLFTQVRYEESAIYPSTTGSPIPPMYPTVFAPTNTAFAHAGLASEAAVKQWVLSLVRIDTIWFDPFDYLTNAIPGYGYTANFNYQFNYATADSLLSMHYLLTSTQLNGDAFAAVLCYNDLTRCPSLNNGVLNQSFLNGNPISITPFSLLYHADASGTLDIQWNASGSGNVPVPLDDNQSTRQRTFWTINGVVYATDQLFFKP